MKLATVIVVRSETESAQVNVPQWEVPVLQMVHGPEKISLVGEMEDKDRPFPNAQEEFERLSQRYGADTKTDVHHVAAVYGQPPFGLAKLDEEINRVRKLKPEAKNGETPKVAKATATRGPVIASIDE